LVVQEDESKGTAASLDGSIAESVALEGKGGPVLKDGAARGQLWGLVHENLASVVTCKV
jgi:hypothetical protein